MSGACRPGWRERDRLGVVAGDDLEFDPGVWKAASDSRASGRSSSAKLIRPQRLQVRRSMGLALRVMQRQDLRAIGQQQDAQAGDRPDHRLGQEISAGMKWAARISERQDVYTATLGLGKAQALHFHSTRRGTASATAVIWPEKAAVMASLGGCRFRAGGKVTRAAAQIGLGSQ